MGYKPTIYVHIGAGKTGSSTIQRFLKMYEENLKNAGYLIFNSNFQPHTGNETLSIQQSYFEKLHINNPDRVGIFVKQFQENLQYMQINGYKGAIISAENLLNDWEQFIDLFLPLRHLCHWRIIAYVRNQPQYLESSWKEWGYLNNTNMQHWFEGGIGKIANWTKQLSPWEQAFGIDSVVVRVLDKRYMLKGSLASDFARQIKFDFLINEESSDVYVNKSLSNRTIRVLEYLRDDNVIAAERERVFAEARPIETTNNKGVELRMHLNKVVPNYKNLLSRTKPAAAFDDQDEVIDLFPAEWYVRIHQTYYESNRILVERYYPGVAVDDIFPPKTKVNYRQLSEAELQRHALRLTFENMRIIDQMVQAQATSQEAIRTDIQQLRSEHSVQIAHLWQAQQAIQQQIVALQQAHQTTLQSKMRRVLSRVFRPTARKTRQPAPNLTPAPIPRTEELRLAMLRHHTSQQ
ncbi:MAG: hypothetical protein ACO3F2_13620 [Roseiflexaceae bacterium]